MNFKELMIVAIFELIIANRLFIEQVLDCRILSYSPTKQNMEQVVVSLVQGVMILR